MIRVYGGSGSTFRDVTLPWSLSWNVQNPRKMETFTTLTGSEIQQASAKSTSAGTAVYSHDVDSSLADDVMELDAATSDCFVSDGDHCYSAKIDANIKPSPAWLKTTLSITFKIVQRIF